MMTFHMECGIGYLRTKSNNNAKRKYIAKNVLETIPKNLKG